jgi:ribose-phosphate pyrophosphokinase
LRESVRRKEVFLVQSTAPPVDEHLVELLAPADACRRAVALRITAIMPFFGYGRSDKRSGRREPIMGRVVADVLQAVGTGHVVTVDLHPALRHLFVTDTVGPGAPPNTTVVSVAPLIAAAVERVLADGAVGDIY